MGVRDDRKVTPGITESSRPRVHIDGEACYIDVGFSYPGRAENFDAVIVFIASHYCMRPRVRVFTD